MGIDAKVRMEERLSVRHQNIYFQNLQQTGVEECKILSNCHRNTAIQELPISKVDAT